MAEGGGKWGFQYKEIEGDLFDCPDTDSLVHCVSEDLAMGKGIAVKFKKKFGKVLDLKSQDKKTGQVAVLKEGKRYIYYLITKAKANDKPKLNSLRLSLEELKKHCLGNGVESLAMPTIGCGLDGLNWEEVSTILRKVFSDMKINITVYIK